MNSTRHQQLLSLIKRIISTELQEIDHELFHLVVVTDVLLSNDGQECRVWVTAPESTINLLNTKYRGEIHRQFMKQYPRKHIPRLIFMVDQGEVERMDALLDKIEETEPTND